MFKKNHSIASGDYSVWSQMGFLSDSLCRGSLATSCVIEWVYIVANEWSNRCHCIRPVRDCGTMFRTPAKPRQHIYRRQMKTMECALLVITLGKESTVCFQYIARLSGKVSVLTHDCMCVQFMYYKSPLILPDTEFPSPTIAHFFRRTSMDKWMLKVHIAK